MKTPREEQLLTQLAREVDYWKDRAEKAETRIREMQEAQIKQAGNWDLYQETLALVRML